MIKIKLTEKDFINAERIGRLRANQNGTTNFGNKNIKNEIIGVLGELSVLQYYNKQPSWIFGKGDISDVILFNKNVDVKTSLLKPFWIIDNLNLLVMKDTHESEIYIQVFITSEEEHAIIYGWTTRKFLVENAKEWEYQNKLFYKLSCSKLFKMESLGNGGVQSQL
jgi:hypothetical protein